METEDELDGTVIDRHHKLKQLNSLEAINRGLHFKRAKMAVTHEQDKASFCSIAKLWLAGISKCYSSYPTEANRPTTSEGPRVSCA